MRNFGFFLDTAFRSHYNYFPFSIGPRNCIGQNFAQVRQLGSIRLCKGGWGDPLWSLLFFDDLRSIVLVKQPSTPLNAHKILLVGPPLSTGGSCFCPSARCIYFSRGVCKLEQNKLTWIKKGLAVRIGFNLNIIFFLLKLWSDRAESNVINKRFYQTIFDILLSHWWTGEQSRFAPLPFVSLFHDAFSPLKIFWLWPLVLPSNRSKPRFCCHASFRRSSFLWYLDSHAIFLKESRFDPRMALCVLWRSEINLLIDLSLWWFGSSSQKFLLWRKRVLQWNCCI